MRKILASATICIVALVLFLATVYFGGVSIDLLTPAYCLAIVATVLWSGKLIFADVVSWKQSPLHLPAFLFLGYACFRYFSSPLEYDSRFELFQISLYALFYLLLASNCYRANDRSILLITLMVLATGESVYAIWQIATKAELVLGAPRPTQYFNRGSGTYLCPNHLAGFLEMTWGLLLANIVFRRAAKGSVQRSALQKVFLAYVALVTLVGIVVSLSRGGWIATLAALLVLLFWGDWRSGMFKRRLIAVAVGVSLFGLLLWNIRPVQSYIQQTFKSQDGKKPIELQDPTLGDRTVMSGATLSIIKDNLWLGTGPNTWQWFYPKYRHPSDQTHADYAHNDVLNLTSDYGIVGLILVLWALAAFYWHAAVLARNKSSSEKRCWAIGSVLGVTAILVHSWVDFNMHIPANALLFITLMGMTVAMDDTNDRWRRIELKRPSRYALAVVLLLFCFFGMKSIIPTYVGDHYNNLGREYKRSLQWDRALQYFEQAISWDPKFPEPHEKMGVIYRTQARFRINPTKHQERLQLAQKAIVAFKKSLQLNPYQSGVLLELADAYEMAEDDDSALKTYERALAIDPNSAINYFCLGRFYRRLEKDDLAQAAFEKSKALNFWSDLGASRNLEELRDKKK